MNINTILFNGARKKGLLVGGHLCGISVWLIALAWAQKGWTPAIVVMLLIAAVLQVRLHIVLKRIQLDLDTYQPNDVGSEDNQ